VSTVYIRFAVRGFDALQRAPILERLIANAGAPTAVANWREEAFRVLAPAGAPMPSVAGAVYQSREGNPTAEGVQSRERALTDLEGVWVCVATPVNLVAGMSNVTMGEQGILSLSVREAAALAADFNRVFVGAGVKMIASGSLLLCVFDREMDVNTHEPEAAAGSDVFDYQPSGRDASRMRRLVSEIEMWLFDHAINRERAAKSLPAITGLWLWGGGAANVELPRPDGWVTGLDPLFAAFGNLAAFPSDSGSGVVVSAHRPGSSEWHETETRWLLPAVESLRTGRIARLELSGGDRRVTLTKIFNWRFWRRPRPWWESYGIQ
jgi:hypothetical protein